MSKFADHYNVLGVSSLASRGEIEQAYSRHVASGKIDTSIKLAFAVLHDPYSRSVYDGERSRHYAKLGVSLAQPVARNAASFDAQKKFGSAEKASQTTPSRENSRRSPDRLSSLFWWQNYVLAWSWYILGFGLLALVLLSKIDTAAKEMLGMHMGFTMVVVTLMYLMVKTLMHYLRLRKHSYFHITASVGLLFIIIPWLTSFGSHDINGLVSLGIAWLVPMVAVTLVAVRIQDRILNPGAGKIAFDTILIIVLGMIVSLGIQDNIALRVWCQTWLFASLIFRL